MAIAVDCFCFSFCHKENPKQPSYISLWNDLCYDNAATMFKKKSSILRIQNTTKIKSLNGKCFLTYYYGQVLNLNIGDVIKNNPSLCDVFDIMREMTCKLLKKTFLKRHSCKSRMNTKSKSREAHTFSPIHCTVIGESCSSV